MLVEEGKVTFADSVNVGLPPEKTIRVLHVAVDAMVTVGLPELLSKYALSALVGLPAPPGPPLEDAQLLVNVLFQVPLPPTQKYVAICVSFYA